mmetsp:Transcript_58553/g.96654  ORF Transcript_58553/g.96654 Transcript_58553/m.96654 type:complete len:292 (-) Transcript_58553:414-1289(-)
MKAKRDQRFHALLAEWGLEQLQEPLKGESIWSCLQVLEKQERVGFIKWLAEMGIGPQPVRQKLASSLAKAKRDKTLGHVTPPAWDYIPPPPPPVKVRQPEPELKNMLPATPMPSPVAANTHRLGSRQPVTPTHATTINLPNAPPPAQKFLERRRAEADAELPPPPTRDVLVPSPKLQQDAQTDATLPHSSQSPTRRFVGLDARPQYPCTAMELEASCPTESAFQASASISKCRLKSASSMPSLSVISSASGGTEEAPSRWSHWHNPWRYIRRFTTHAGNRFDSASYEVLAG